MDLVIRAKRQNLKGEAVICEDGQIWEVGKKNMLRGLTNKPQKLLLEDKYGNKSKSVFRYYKRENKILDKI